LGEARLEKPSSPVQKFIRIRFIMTEIWPRGAPTSGDALTWEFSHASESFLQSFNTFTEGKEYLFWRFIPMTTSEETHPNMFIQH
jgi:hypothetical protein